MYVYHSLRSSASSVLTATAPVSGKGQTNDTTQPIVKTFVTGDLVRETYTAAKTYNWVTNSHTIFKRGEHYCRRGKIRESNLSL